MEVEISSNMKFFKLYMSARKAISWGNIGTFISLRLQSTADIFLASELMGGVRSASMTRPPFYGLAWVHKNQVTFSQASTIN